MVCEPNLYTQWSFWDHIRSAKALRLGCYGEAHLTGQLQLLRQELASVSGATRHKHSRLTRTQSHRSYGSQRAQVSHSDSGLQHTCLSAMQTSSGT